MTSLLGEKPSLALSTVCDEKFANQAIAMIGSVEENSSIEITWFILALTDPAYKILSGISKPNWHILNLSKIDDEFYSLLDVRPWREFCWTAAAVVLNYVANFSHASYVGYLDSDCFFFRDIAEYFHDLGDASVLIVPHDFSPDRYEWRYKSGLFNVGLILGKQDENFRTCVAKWRRSVLDECVVDPALGKCGDQTYLNDWPKEYDFVHVLNRRGSALGPWNLNNFKRVDEIDWKIDLNPIHFFHFHGLVVCQVTSIIFLFLPSPGYKHSLENRKVIYKHYVKALREVSKSLKLQVRHVRIREFILNCLRARQLPSILIHP